MPSSAIPSFVAGARMASEADRLLLSKIGNFDPPPDISAARQIWEEFGEQLNRDLPQNVTLHESVELKDGLKADIAVPLGPGPFPVVIYLHAGGWCFGTPKSFRKLGMHFAANGYVCVNLDYRLSPEHRFPAHLEDVLGALDAIPLLARRYNADSSRVFLAGESAGANLALVATMASSDGNAERLSPVRGLLLFYGVYDLAGALEKANHHPGLVLQVKSYVGPENYPAKLVDTLVSPLGTESPKFPSTVPPCIILEGGDDPIVGGEGRKLFNALGGSEKGHELYIVPGMPHSFMQIFGLEGCDFGWSRTLEFMTKHAVLIDLDLEDSLK